MHEAEKLQLQCLHCLFESAHSQVTPAFAKPLCDPTPSHHIVSLPLCSKSRSSFKPFCTLVGAQLSTSPLSSLRSMNRPLVLGQKCFAWLDWLETLLLPCWRRILLPQKIQQNRVLLICLSTARQQLIKVFCASWGGFVLNRLGRNCTLFCQPNCTDNKMQVCERFDR